VQGKFILTMLMAGFGAMAASCASLPPASYTEIQRVRHQFLGGQTIGLAYDPVMWDGMIEGKGVAGRHTFGPNAQMGNYELAFYVRVKNVSRDLVPVTFSYFKLLMASGQTYTPGPATASTSRPFPTTELHPQGWTEGYLVFELPPDGLVKDRPATLQYDDGQGHQAVRYLALGEMVRYEGLSAEAAAPPSPPLPKGEQRRWVPGRWETRWVPHHGRYEPFWVEGHWEEAGNS